ncbi:MAC/Perforin domain-containing protein [Pedobacter terrae]|uniref:MAC/Perforin domain-containing protein n=1 Tax=Pedobacter terrae TaxID=405671 RepID=A0A1G8BHV7_9SPHI|nr:MAC/perforin domain-containing protein [Pedobacter terrae]SDH32701.1 MAC/Perforin domain-containing protein [Pedobacter terrae]
MKNNYKLKIIYLLCVVTAAFSSCKKNELAEEKGLANNHHNFAFTGHPIYHVLGYGYDVTGRLANAQSAKLSVLNIDKYISENPALFSLNDDVNDYFEYSYGENVESYSKKLTQKYHLGLDLNFLKVAKLFKTELNASFAKKDSAYAKYVYASVRKMIKQRSMKIYFTKENLINNYLTDQFKSDLVSLSATALVERYGTHVLTDIELGARLDMNYEAQTNNSKREEAATAGASLSVGKIFNVSADITTNSVDANSNFNQRLYYNSVGGDGSKSLIGEIALDNSTLKINIANWQSSCTRDNAALINIGQDGLLSLEDLVSDPVKKQEVKAAVEKYIIDRQMILVPEKYTPSPVGVYYSQGLNVWRYEFNIDNIPYLRDGSWQYKQTYFSAFKVQATGTVPVYEYWAPTTNDCLWDRNANLSSDPYWHFGGIKFYAYATQQPGTVPIYRYYHHRSRRSHFLGPDPGRPYPQNEWTNEGVAFYAFPAQ